MARDPADVGGAPENVGVVNVEDILVGDFRAKQVAGGGMENPLGFAGRTAGVKDEQRRFAVEFLRRTFRVHVIQLPMPPDIAALGDVDFVIGAPEHNDFLGRLRQQVPLRVFECQRFVHVFLQLNHRSAPEAAVGRDDQFRL